MTRIWVSDVDLDEAVSVLESRYISVDLDGGDRLLVSDDEVPEALEILDSEVIDYEII